MIVEKECTACPRNAMKLAREIAEAVYREQEEIRDRFRVELGRGTAEGIIAAKLKPVKEGFQAIRDTVNDESLKWQDKESLIRQVCIVALALCEERQETSERLKTPEEVSISWGLHL